MKTPSKQPFATFFLMLFASLSVNAQKGDNYGKLGATAFFLSDGLKINHFFLSLGAAYEHQFSGQVAGSVNLNIARLISDAGDEDGFIRNINSLEAELRFYPNKKGKGFYAGASAVLYRDNRITGSISDKSYHFGSHINTGVQFPMEHDFYLQVNGQVGIYGKGYSTISRYGVNVMLGKRF